MLPWCGTVGSSALSYKEGKRRHQEEKAHICCVLFKRLSLARSSGLSGDHRDADPCTAFTHSAVQQIVSGTLISVLRSMPRVLCQGTQACPQGEVGGGAWGANEQLQGKG